MKRIFLTAVLLQSIVAYAEVPSPTLAPADKALAVLPPFPTDAECLSLPVVRMPLAFQSGETLDYDLDAMGAKAGRMTMKVLPLKDGALPIEVSAETNTFFSKVRKVKGSGTSYMNPRNIGTWVISVAHN